MFPVRHSAKELTSLILDEERLRAERTNRGSWKSRVTGLEDVSGGTSGGEGSQQQPRPQRRERRRPEGSNTDDDDLEYKLALEASKNEAEADAARRKGSTVNNDDMSDDDLAKAIRLSKEEEDLRKRQFEDQDQGDLLFDNTPTTEQVPQPTGFNQGYQQQPQVDWYGNPVGQQQSQPTGFLNNAYSQPTGQQPFQNGGAFGSYNQPQPTGYEQMQQPQQQFLQPQNTYNPWAQQMNGSGQQQQPQQPVQEQPTAQPGSKNPWASTQQSSTPISAQPTGSNNPFASVQQQSVQPPRHTQSAFSKVPTLSTLAEQQASNNFNQRPNPIQNFQSQQPVPTQQRPAPVTAQTTQPTLDPYKANLNSLLASGEGQDTFGNVGEMRIPSQHTAPGTFVNSAGAGSMGRLEASRTGVNPFFTQQPSGLSQVQYPAQTGFAGNANPFGRPQQQQQQQAGQGQHGGGSLIDL